VEAKVFFIIEASHLFRAGDKYHTQFFVTDVVHFLQRHYFPTSVAKTIVLHGSVKDDQAARYAASLTRHGVQVIRMRPIASAISAEKWFFRPTYSSHKMMGTEIPKGSQVVLIGFHNSRYLTFLQKYAKDFKLGMAVFHTPSKRLGEMHIPKEFEPYLKRMIDLDKHVDAIKAEFHKEK